MDTRQLAAFCAVVERKSFSQAAERLGVTQPAVSLQVRSLEKRLGRQLLDRSGRRVEPTEAGLALYRGAQRMLQLEEQLVEELEAEAGGELSGARQALVGPTTLDALAGLRARTFFLDAAAVDVRGTYACSTAEARVARGLAEIADEVVLLASGGVFTCSAPALVATLDRLTAVVADVEPPTAVVAKLDRVGVKLHVAG